MKRVIVWCMSLVLATVTFSGCLDNSTQVSRFRILDVTFRKLQDAGTASLRNGPIVRGRFIIQYQRGNATAVVFEWAYGQQDPSQPWHEVGSDPDLDGEYTFDTTFTSVNWVTIRGTATTPGGQVVVDQRVVNIDNRPPDVSVSPRDRSVLNSPPTAIVINVVDGGATEGTDEAGTEVAVSVDGVPLVYTRTNAENQIRLIPSSWPDGSYEVTVTPKDITGNVGTPVASSFVLDSTIQGASPSVAITGPADGNTLSGTVDLTYSFSPGTVQVWVDYAFGKEEPLAWTELGEDLVMDGVFGLDTTFTRQNWVSVRLFAKGPNGLTAVSGHRTYLVQNP